MKYSLFVAAILVFFLVGCGEEIADTDHPPSQYGEEAHKTVEE
mgnify:CR=1 FL=1|tara:strand:- start:15 stop:143 length:129 start_codon:yes stop_codon:yes gene_type:complete